MTAMERIERRHRALMNLVEYVRWQGKRDDLVREAVDAGLSKTYIAEIIGVSRSTVYDILARAENGKAGQ